MMLRRLASLALLGALLLPGAGAAAEATTGTDRLPAVDSFPTPLAAPLWRLGMALAGVSAASGALAFWTRRRRRAVGGDGAQIRILANRSLSSRHQVVLLDVGGHRLLVGTGADTVTVLADLSERDLFSGALDRHAPRGERAPSAEFGAIGRFEGLDA